jgi:dTMP kinase
MADTPRGRFIVIEGPEGAGKSSQAQRLQAALEARGRKVILTHEPGGTATGEAVRLVLLDGRHHQMTPLTELFLFCASRAQHVAEVIEPALAEGAVVVCDRFSPSTIVYQGYAGSVAMETVVACDRAARQGLLPDLTIILDVPAEEGLARGLSGARGDRIESKEIGFHQRVREGYLRYAETAEEPCAVVPAGASEDEVARQVLALALKCIAGPDIA